MPGSNGRPARREARSSDGPRRKALLKAEVKRLIWTRGASLARRLGVGARRGLPDRPDTLRILMYHKVNDQPGNPLSVSTRSFREQQAFLAERYRVVSLDDVMASLAGVRPLPTRAVLLTFDDGYRDNLVHAYPILREHGHRAVLFAPTDFIDTSRPLPHDERVTCDNATLSWADLREMQDVFEIGSHGCSHRSMPRLAVDEATDEIRRSKRILEERLGHGVRAFAYVKGDWNDRLEEVVRACGYEVAFNTVPGTNVPPLHAYRLERYNVDDYGIEYFSQLLDGSADFLALKDTHVGHRIKDLVNDLVEKR
jgi:peptidoglycan/xylan/chitin deacetylase (PgdA/CDA1 family)